VPVTEGTVTQAVLLPEIQVASRLKVKTRMVSDRDTYFLRPGSALNTINHPTTQLGQTLLA
jgi:hypothetical protein